MLKPTVNAVRRARLRGDDRECSCCGATFSRFAAAGNPRRPDSECPACGSRERHRLLALAIRDREAIGGRALHFAPDRATGAVLRSRCGEYVTTDLEERADVQADITRLPFDDNSWDVIVCSHVLEHVPDDSTAIAELRRVLSDGGTALIAVPHRPGAVTDEDPSITDANERIRRFGQSDHVRIYGDDLVDRLRAGGFTNVEPIAPDDFPDPIAERFALRATGGGSQEVTLICR